MKNSSSSRSFVCEGGGCGSYLLWATSVIKSYITISLSFTVSLDQISQHQVAFKTGLKKKESNFHHCGTKAPKHLTIVI